MVAPNTNQAIEFLKAWRIAPTLTAIDPEEKRPPDTCAFAKPVDWEAVRQWIDKHNGTRNIYFSVNPLTKEAQKQNKKASREGIQALAALHVDLDPRLGETQEQARERLTKVLREANPKPSVIIASGGGVQGFWMLAEPHMLGGTLAMAEDAKLWNVALERKFGGDSCHDICRIMRLPGTINLPNATKRAKGRVPALAEIVEADYSRLYSLEQFEKAAADAPKSEAQPAPSGAAAIRAEPAVNKQITIAWAQVPRHAGWLKSAADLPSDFSAKGHIIVGHSGSLKDLQADLADAGVVEKPYASWSEVTHALAAIFKADGRYSPEQIAAALMCPLPCNQHVTKEQDEAKRRRAIERSLSRSHEPSKWVRGELPWRETRVNGSPIPSMHNARLCIDALGIKCRHDTFHNKLLVGFDGDVMHEVQLLVGEVTDNTILALRTIISKRYGFDPEDKHTRDAVQSIALEHCFDPVCELIDEAQRVWEQDRQNRIDRFAPDYLNTDDTPLSRALARKHLIAAVRRVRQPGCKYDMIVVLESPEGLNKSSAIRVLAGHENFSDESILGQRGREVQEQLADVWMHESSELAGMSRADIENVKAFASRQEDRARPAYGHYLRRQKRHSIEWGTTNDSEYLQSLTGNRRFGCLAVRCMIDLDKLQRDRLLLLGEAAHYEAQGESLVIDEKLWPDAREENERRRIRDPWEDILADIPAKYVHRVGDREAVSSADLLGKVLHIEHDKLTRAHSMRLAPIMKRLGWERDGNKVWIGDQQVRGYSRPAPLGDGQKPKGGGDGIPF